MSDNDNFTKDDMQMRISLQKLADDDGEWLDAPTEETTILRAAIFESFFSYVTLAAEEAGMEFQMDLSPEKILNAMLKRSELDVLDALLKTYKNKFNKHD